MTISGHLEPFPADALLQFGLPVQVIRVLGWQDETENSRSEVRDGKLFVYVKDGMVGGKYMVFW